MKNILKNPKALLLNVGLLATQLSFGQAATEKPNFLFIFADDQTYKSIGALNNSEVETPNLDKLAGRSVVFSQCYNQGSWSAAVSVASRTMLITGQYVFDAAKNKAYLGKGKKSEAEIKNAVPLWGEVLQNAGYETYLTGKWHNSDYAALKSFTYAKGIGKGMYETLDPSGSREPAYGRPADDKMEWKPWDKKFTGHWSPKVKDIVTDANGKKTIGTPYVVNKHTSELYADNAIDFLGGNISKSDKPFFMYVAFNAPHDPRQSPKKFVKKYPVDKINIPENFLPEHPFDQGDHKCRDEILAPFPRTKEAVQLHRQEYYAIISHMDEQIGRILKALEKSGKAKNTYIIFTSDHGLAVGMHGLMGKQNQYDHSVRMPFMIAGPKLEAGKKVDAKIYMQSIYATTCELANIEVPKTVQFKSIKDLLTGKTDKGEDAIFGCYKQHQRMVRTDKYKLIAYPKANKLQLFDIVNDPNEVKNLANDPKFLGKKVEMFIKLVTKQNELGDDVDLSDQLIQSK